MFGEVFEVNRQDVGVCVFVCVCVGGGGYV